jgi:hypothetical protein
MTVLQRTPNDQWPFFTAHLPRNTQQVMSLALKKQGGNLELIEKEVDKS